MRILLAVLLIAPPQSAANPPALPDPAGITTTVTVSTAAQLQTAVANLTSNTKIVIQPGTYTLTQQLVIDGVTNVALRGATGNRDDVVIVGAGMTDSAVPHGIQVFDAQQVLIADLSVGQVYYHPITLHGEQGCSDVHVYNVRCFDGGEQLLKSNWSGTAGTGVDNGRVEYCVFEYTTTAPSDYTNGVDVHNGDNWIIRHSLFRNIRAPVGDPLAGPAILMWSGSTNTLVEGNTFLNCERGIQFGLIDQAGNDHVGGIIRNNAFYREPGETGDVGIAAFDSPNTQILHNTVITSGTYATPIEYRWESGVVVANNLLDGSIWPRDGATGSETNNLTNATASMFVDDELHLAASVGQAPALANCADDFDGDARGGSADIGCDQVTAASSTPQGASGGSEGENGDNSCNGRITGISTLPLLILALAALVRRK